MGGCHFPYQGQCATNLSEAIKKLLFFHLELQLYVKSKNLLYGNS